jgi:Sec7-like guanine-nucleotide exchange factor
MKILKDNFVKILIKNATGYKIEKNVLKIFYLKYKMNETVIKNRIKYPVKNIEYKNNSLLITF